MDQLAGKGTQLSVPPDKIVHRSSLLFKGILESSGGYANSKGSVEGILSLS